MALAGLFLSSSFVLRSRRWRATFIRQFACPFVLGGGVGSPERAAGGGLRGAATEGGSIGTELVEEGAAPVEAAVRIARDGVWQAVAVGGFRETGAYRKEERGIWEGEEAL